MKALLQLQWSMHKSSLFFIILAIAVMSLFFHNQVSEMSLVFFAIAFTINNVTVSKRIFTDNNSQLLLYTMPIARTAFIKNIYMTSFLLCSAVYALVLPIQVMNGLVTDQLDSYLISLLGFYGGTLIGSAYHLSFQLENLLEDSSFDAFLSYGAGMFIVVVPHLLLLNFIEHESSFWLRLFIMPTISVLLYQYLMQRSVKKFAQRELL